MKRSANFYSRFPILVFLLASLISVVFIDVTVPSGTWGPIVVASVWLIPIGIFLLAELAAKADAKDKAKQAQEKEYQVSRIVAAMERAAKSELVPALQTLREVGLCSSNFTRGHDIQLPKYFWAVGSEELLAWSLMTIVSGNSVVQKQSLHKELSRIIEFRAMVAPRQALRVATLIQKTKPAMGETLFT